MKTLKILSISIVSLTMIFSSCKKDEDTMAPTIDSITVDGEDHEVTVNAGSTMNIVGTFSDNEDLGEWKIDMHDDFDSHNHGKTTLTVSPFSYQETLAISGTQTTETHQVDVPANASAGPYHFICRLLDANGNEGSFVEIEVTVVNGSEPVVNITQPDFSGHVHVDRGDSLTITGTITDDADLDEIIIELAEEEGHTHKTSGLSSTPIFEADFDLTGANDTSWDFNQLGAINIGANVEVGDYTLTVVAKDADGNYTVWEGDLHIE